VLVVVVVLTAATAMLVVAAMRPDGFSVQRSATIKAPPEKI
jgi:hypothetical protein